ALLETIGVIIVAILGFYLGRMFSGYKKPHWTLGYFFPCLLMVILLAARCSGSLAFIAPFSWMIAGRTKFVILALIVTMSLTTPLSRLPRKFEKVIVCSLMVLVVSWFSVFPFLAPALIKGRLSSINTRFDAEGICYQSTDYTCAPAAAVTALKKLGLSATEGELAILAHTSPVAGTLPICLEAALQQRYAKQGLECKYRRFKSISELSDGITLAVVRDAFLSDHCVAVLKVSENTVTIADPVTGKMLMSHEQFKKIWRYTGIQLKRNTPQSS
ncbi:MAG: cysteine peptidase family C39 domain-containing protein, partial [Planctomycetota bacterium]